MLSGHTDVVPVDGQPWDTDPFTATIKDDRIYGRGICDMKSFIAAALAMTPRFLAADLKAPVHFALSYDEELGCLGVRGLIEDLARADIKPAGCIIGEPTEHAAGDREQGRCATFRCCVRGKEAHSALAPHGVNAIEYAARLVVYIRQIADRMRDCETRDHGFEVPFTTLQTGRDPRRHGAEHRAAGLRGPLRVPLPAGRRSGCARARDQVLRRARARAGDARSIDSATFESFETKAEIPGLDPSVEGAEQDRVTSLAQALARNPAIAKVAYATEAGLFQRPASRRSSAGPARSSRPTSRTSSSRSSRSRSASRSWSGCSRSFPVRECLNEGDTSPLTPMPEEALLHPSNEAALL